MTFEIDKFVKTTFEDRTKAIPVPRLKKFFSADSDSVWVVRGLTSTESALSKQEIQNNRNIEAILKAIGSKNTKDIAEGLTELMDLDKDKVPDELVQRFAWLRYGSVDPKCSQELAMKLADNFPEDFFLLTNKIMELTGQGRVGELKDFGETK